MQSDMKHFYDITPMISFDNFVELFLVTFALKDIYLSKGYMTATIPVNYRDAIEEILNSWPMKFSKFIDIDWYYEDQYGWECEFVSKIQQYLLINQKVYCYDFQSNTIDVDFTKQEVEDILVKYDEDLKEDMIHFTNLVKDFGNYRNMCLENRKCIRNIARASIMQVNKKENNKLKRVLRKNG